MHWRTTTVRLTSVSLRCHLCGLHLMGMYACMYVCIYVLNIILPHVCAIQVCIYVDGGSYDDPKIDWLEADPLKWSVIIDLV